MTINLTLKFKSINSEKREVEGVVYTPNVIDAHGEFITYESLKALKEMSDIAIKEKTYIIDVNHNKKATKSLVIENYINGEEKTNSNYELGEWIQKTKIQEDDIWEKVKSGKLNAFSINFMGSEENVEAEIMVQKVKYSVTDSNINDHEHYTYLQYNESGKCLGGRTSDHIDEDGSVHYHQIDHSVTTSKTVYKKGLGVDHPHRVKR
jgi:hypothetical protein